jgi:hypothetical protein
MEITAILMSRALAFIETAELSPRGGLFFPELIKELVHRFNFQKFPRAIEEWKSDEGSQFLSGKFDKTVIDRLVLYADGILIDTQAGTTESKRVLEALLDWTREKFGIVYGPEMVREWAYVNNLTFHSDVPLLITGPMERLAKAITADVTKSTGRELIYEPIGLNIGHDVSLRKHGKATFNIQRRLGVPFASNKYYSESPLQTDTHIALLEQYEKDVAEMLNPRLLAERS